MTHGGLLTDPARFLHDAAFRRATLVQIGFFAVILSVSAFYHFYLRPSLDKSASKGSAVGMNDEDIAEIDALIVYPVKSGRGIALDSAQVTRKGFQYDRRWAVVAKEGKKRLNLKDEPKITLLIPSFEGDVLRLRASKESAVSLPDIGVPLSPSPETLQSWPLVEGISFYGDSADGREAQLAEGEWEWKDTPSAWVSKLLGYPVCFLQFEPTSSKRNAFPIFKPPHDLGRWDATRQKELNGPTQIEFQDIYPFLIATRESLGEVNAHLRTALEKDAFKYDRSYWSAKAGDIGLPVERFRPNIVLRSRRRSGEEYASAAPMYPGFSEDSWETVWVETKEGTLPIHLVARCERCLLTTVDPETAHRDPNVPLAILRKERKRDAQPGVKPRPGPCFGMYSIPEQQRDGGYARIAVGDPVRVRWRPYELDDEVTLGTRKKQHAHS